MKLMVTTRDGGAAGNFLVITVHSARCLLRPKLQSAGGARHMRHGHREVWKVFHTYICVH